MADLRAFLDEIGGKDRVWAVQLTEDAQWLPVCACALSVPLKEKPDRRVLFFIDAGSLGRGHNFYLGGFERTPVGVSGVTLSNHGIGGTKLVLRGSNRDEWPPDISRWFLGQGERRESQFEAAKRFIVQEYEVAESNYQHFEKGR